MENVIELKEIGKRIGNTKVLKSISFDVKESSINSILGTNGTGKSTILNIISKNLKHDSGELIFNKNDLDLNIAMVSQDYRNSLFPWKNCKENILLPLKIKGMKKSDRVRSFEAFIDEFKIELNFLKYPYQLSGGEQQLITILRSIIQAPKLLLLDEPFSALDFERRFYLHQFLIKIWNKLNLTIMLISHDIDEAIYLSDKIIILDEKPSIVAKIIDVNLPRPRSIDCMVTPEFNKIKSEVIHIFSSSITAQL